MAMSEIVPIKELEKRYQDEWILVEVVEENEFQEPIKGKLIAHSKDRDELYERMKEAIGDISLFFAGDIPKKGYAVAF